MKSMLIVILLAFSGAFFSFTGSCPDACWGTKTIYHEPVQAFQTAPAGYVPVFINYVGRHGARHLTSIGEDSLLFVFLKQAEKVNGLTALGTKLKQMDSLLMIVEEGNVSLISERGFTEQEGLGKRMCAHYGNVFSTPNTAIRVFTTKKERTRQSAKAFLDGLYCGDDHSVVMKTNDNDHLAFYDVAPAYKKFKEEGSWKASMEIIRRQENAHKLFEELPKRFFTPEFLQSWLVNPPRFEDESKSIAFTPDRFLDAYYTASSIVASLDKEIERAGFTPFMLDFGSLVTCDELKELEYIDSAEDFLVKGPGTNVQGIQVRIAIPLLVDFLRSTQAFLDTGKVVADLRFAHAETIAPFAALLGMENASTPVSPEHILNYNRVWHCEKIIPLSANIQWTLFQKKGKDYLVEFTLNERPVSVKGLKNAGFLYFYFWKDVREHYRQILQENSVTESDDMHDYLLHVK